MISVHGVVWDAKYYWCEAFTQTEKVIVLGFVKDRDKIRPSQSDAGRHIFMSHWPRGSKRYEGGVRTGA